MEVDAKDFEKKLAEINEILAKFKSGELTLSESLGAYERANSLITEASAILESAKAQIREIDARTGGQE